MWHYVVDSYLPTFRLTCCHHLWSTLKMEAASSSKRLVSVCQSTGCHILDDINIHSHHHETRRSHRDILVGAYKLSDVVSLNCCAVDTRGAQQIRHRTHSCLGTHTWQRHWKTSSSGCHPTHFSKWTLLQQLSCITQCSHWLTSRPCQLCLMCAVARVGSCLILFPPCFWNTSVSLACPPVGDENGYRYGAQLLTE
jgi:hypothetical protein